VPLRACSARARSPTAARALAGAGLAQTRAVAELNLKRTSSPVADLTEVVSTGRSGEFICASPTGEVHVFLQRGRIAWATDSAHPYEFSKELRSRANMDEQVFREVVESCRRDRLPLGETLVAWKIASLEVVRAALEHQVRIALASLATHEAASKVFLERRAFAQYDERLTFRLAEVLGPREEAAALPPAPAVVAAVPDQRPESREAAARARELLAAMKGATRVELLEADRSLAIAGDATSARVSAAFRAAALQAGADFVALRSDAGTLIGARLADTAREMWAELPPDATIGVAVASLYTAGVLARLTRARRGTDLVRWRCGSADVEARLGNPFGFGRDVLAVVVLAGDGLVVASGHSLDEAESVALARRHRAVLSAPPRDGEPAGAPGAHGPRTIVAGEERVWCFGAEVPEAGAGTTAWVLTRRDGAQGIGWACLAALSRALDPAAPAPTSP
jgi:hypothetical protein